jgi:hypothetical protein
MKHRYLYWVLLITLFTSCTQQKEKGVKGRVVGFKPIYSNEPDLYSVQNKPARNVVKAGKIYTKGNYIFQNEIGEGIHIIDNTSPANAQRIGFIKIKGSEEISIKGNFLYSNNFSDLVVVDISNIANVIEVNRIRNAFNNNNTQLAPPVNSSYFECVDNSKGTVVSWVRDSIDNPKCKN